MVPAVCYTHTSVKASFSSCSLPCCNSNSRERGESQALRNSRHARHNMHSRHFNSGPPRLRPCVSLPSVPSSTRLCPPLPAHDQMAHVTSGRHRLYGGIRPSVSARLSLPLDLRAAPPVAPSLPLAHRKTARERRLHAQRTFERVGCWHAAWSITLSLRFSTSVPQSILSYLLATGPLRPSFFQSRRPCTCPGTTRIHLRLQPVY